MEYMPEFETARPRTLAEAFAARAAAPGARLIAGGTDLVPNIRRGIAVPEALIDVNGIEEMRGIAATGDGGLRIGAGVTLAELAADARIRDAHPGLVQAALSVAANSHREAGTVGGNLCLDTRCVFYNQSEWWRRANSYCLKSRGEICHVAPKGDHCFAAFSGDLAPALLVLDAEVEIAAPKGGRIAPLASIYRDDGMNHLTLAAEEIIAAVRVPKPPAGLRTGYAKARVRSAIDFPLAGIAAGLRREGDALAELRVALTGTNSMPIRIAGTDELAGGPLDDTLLDALDRLVRDQIQPMNSSFTPPGYRRRVVSNLTRKLVTSLYKGD